MPSSISCRTGQTRSGSPSGLSLALIEEEFYELADALFPGATDGYLTYYNACHRSQALGAVAERPIAGDCKSPVTWVRRLKSYRRHQALNRNRRLQRKASAAANLVWTTA